MSLIFLFCAYPTCAREFSHSEFKKELIKLSAKQQVQLIALLMKFDRTLGLLEQQLQQFGTGPYDVQYCKDSVADLNGSIVKELKKISRIGSAIEQCFNDIVASDSLTIIAHLQKARLLLKNYLEWTTPTLS